MEIRVCLRVKTGSAGLALSGEEQADSLVPSVALDTFPGASQDTPVTWAVGSGKPLSWLDYEINGAIPSQPPLFMPSP